MALNTDASFDTAVTCARLAQEKQAHDLLVLDLSDLDGSPSNYFVIASVDSLTQLRAVRDNILRQMKTDGYDKPRVDGAEEATWIVLDYFDVVVHLMLDEARGFYNLERMWGDAKPIGITSEGAPHELGSIPRRSAIS